MATRTDADVCPSCGGSYVGGGRPRLRWSWWFAIPIVAAAFLIGLFGISRLVDGDEGDAPVWEFCFLGEQQKSSELVPG